MLTRRGKEHGRNLNYGGIARLARRMHHPLPVPGKIKEAFDHNAKLSNLMLDDYFRGEIKSARRAGAMSWPPRPRASPCPRSAPPSFYDQYRAAVCR
jgi:hypothetical protein